MRNIQKFLGLFPFIERLLVFSLFLHLFGFHFPYILSSECQSLLDINTNYFILILLMSFSFILSNHFMKPHTTPNKNQETPLVITNNNNILFYLSPLMSRSAPNGAPENFTGIGMSANTIELQWRPPVRAMRNGDILVYEIRYQKVGSSRDIFVNETGLSHAFQDLEKDTDYLFDIRAYTTKGAGPWSIKVPVHTYGRGKWMLSFTVLDKCMYINV